MSTVIFPLSLTGIAFGDSYDNAAKKLTTEGCHLVQRWRVPRDLMSALQFTKPTGKREMDGLQMNKSDEHERNGLGAIGVLPRPLAQAVGASAEVTQGES
jgi:hypothetical protein